MGRTKYMLSEREEELMDMLWQLKQPMTSLDMAAVDWDRSWKDSYLKIMTRSLLEKGVIKVCGVEQHANIYLRKFEPAFTREEYVAKLAASKINGREQALEVMIQLAKETGEDENSELVKKLEQLREKRRTQE